MKKVLIICSSFRNYGLSYKKAFDSIGFETELCLSPMFGIKKWNIFTRIKRKLGFNIEKYYQKQISNFSKKAVKVFDSFCPDYTFIVLGNMLTYQATTYITNHSYSILFLSDPVSFVPETLNQIHLYHRIYTYEKTDLAEIERLSSKKPRTMFGMVNETVYFPLQHDKKIDVYFVGAIYDFRAEILTRLIEDFPRLIFQIDGNYSKFPNSKRIINASSKRVKRCFSDKNIFEEEVNNKYNSSKIVLNLQHPQTKDGWNSRTTEILGSKSFQITNRNPSIESNFMDCVGFYDDYIDLKHQIEYYIARNDERERIALNGYSKVLSSFTYSHVFKTMMEEIEKEKDNV